MTEKISVPIKGSKLGQKKLISSKKPTKNKKLKGKKKLIDISNRITLEFKYEDFEEETESFFPQVYREESKITIDNVKADLTWTYHQRYRNFKVIPFYELNNSLLNNYQQVYEKYKKIINPANDERIQVGF